MTIAFLIQWPSLTTLIMWPILLISYYKLALKEEGELEEQFREAFMLYKKRVPAFIPRISIMD